MIRSTGRYGDSAGSDSCPRDIRRVVMRSRAQYSRSNRAIRSEPMGQGHVASMNSARAAVLVITPGLEPAGNVHSATAPGPETRRKHAARPRGHPVGAAGTRGGRLRTGATSRSSSRRTLP